MKLNKLSRYKNILTGQFSTEQTFTRKKDTKSIVPELDSEKAENHWSKEMTE